MKSDLKNGEYHDETCLRDEMDNSDDNGKALDQVESNAISPSVPDNSGSDTAVDSIEKTLNPHSLPASDCFLSVSVRFRDHVRMLLELYRSSHVRHKRDMKIVEKLTSQTRLQANADKGLQIDASKLGLSSTVFHIIDNLCCDFNYSAIMLEPSFNSVEANESEAVEHTLTGVYKVLSHNLTSEQKADQNEEKIQTRIKIGVGLTRKTGRRLSRALNKYRLSLVDFTCNTPEKINNENNASESDAGEFMRELTKGLPPSSLIVTVFADVNSRKSNHYKFSMAKENVKLSDTCPVLFGLTTPQDIIAKE